VGRTRAAAPARAALVTALELARDAGAILAAGGVALFLAPASARRGVLPQAAGLGALALGWVVLVATLVPGEDASRAADRLAGPLGALALAVLAVAAAAALLLGRLIARRPWLVFALLALAIPVRLPVELGSQSAILQVPLYAAMALVLCATALGGRVRRLLGEGARSPVDLALAPFAAYAVLSIAWSADAATGAVKAVFFLLPFVVLYRLVVAWWPGGRALRTLSVTLVAVALPIAVLALVQYATRWIFWNDKLEEYRVYGSFFRVNGVFYDPNVLGRFLAVALLVLLAIACASTADRRRALLLAAAAPVPAAALFVTFSQSSALALLAGVAVLSTWLLGERTVAVLLAGVLALGVATAVAVSPSVREGVTSRDGLDRITEGRFDLMRGGVEVWRAHPVAGGGLGSFETLYRGTLTPAELRRTRVTVSHNAPLTVLSELGLIGVLALGAAVAVPARLLARRARRGDDRGLAALAVLALLTAILVHSLLYAALVEDPLTWILAGAAAVLVAVAPGRDPALRRHAAGPVAVPAGAGGR